MEYSTDKSEFNFAISYLNRLNMLFYQVLQARDNYDARVWHNALLSLHSELSTHMSKEKCVELSDALFNLLDDVQAQTIKNQSSGQVTMPISLFRSLKAIEDDLRMILKDAGLETKLADDARKAIR